MVVGERLKSESHHWNGEENLTVSGCARESKEERWSKKT